MPQRVYTGLRYTHCAQEISCGGKKYGRDCLVRQGSFQRQEIVGLRITHVSCRVDRGVDDSSAPDTAGSQESGFRPSQENTGDFRRCCCSSQIAQQTRTCKWQCFFGGCGAQPSSSRCTSPRRHWGSPFAPATQSPRCTSCLSGHVLSIDQGKCIRGVSWRERKLLNHNKKQMQARRPSE